MTNATTLGSRIRKARSQKGMSAGELAAALSLQSTVQVSLWETDRRKPGSQRLGDIASVLGVTTDWLLYGSDKAQTAEGSSSGGFGANLRGKEARSWLHEFRAELARLLDDEEKEDEAYRATLDLAETSYWKGGKHQDWTEDDSLRVLKVARKRVLSIIQFGK